MSSSPSSSNSGKTFSVNPSDNFLFSNNYKLKVTTSAKDIQGNSMNSDWKSLNGFSTDGLTFVLYDDNRSASINDDKLFICFKLAIDETTIDSNFNNDFEIIGDGVIGSSSSVIYDSNLNLYELSLNGNGTSSSKILVNSDSLKIKNNTIKLDGSSSFLINQTEQNILPIKEFKEQIKIILIIMVMMDIINLDMPKVLQGIRRKKSF